MARVPCQSALAMNAGILPRQTLDYLFTVVKEIMQLFSRLNTDDFLDSFQRSFGELSDVLDSRHQQPRVLVVHTRQTSQYVLQKIGS